MNGGKHEKERKSGESNRICRKNKESTREDRSSIEKSIGEYEEASR